jgi:hypothetical protein
MEKSTGKSFDCCSNPETAEDDDEKDSALPP